MAKTLDFNRLTAPVLPIVMMDADRTTIKVSTPREELIEELEEILPELEPQLRSGSREAIDLCYDLAAKLMSHNRSFVTVTANDLRGKYNLELHHLLAFFQAYLEFIGEITNAKN